MQKIFNDDEIEDGLIEKILGLRDPKNDNEVC